MFRHRYIGVYVYICIYQEIMTAIHSVKRQGQRERNEQSDGQSWSIEKRAVLGNKNEREHFGDETKQRMNTSVSLLSSVIYLHRGLCIRIYRETGRRTETKRSNNKARTENHVFVFLCIVRKIEGKREQQSERKPLTTMYRMCRVSLN